MKQVHVAAGIIVRDNQIFLTQRHLNAHQGGKWEFPGGKVEADETVAQALARELREEVSIDILACQPFMVIEHDYGDKQVKLEFFLVEQFQGEPQAQEGNNQQWCPLANLAELDFPAANQPVVEKLLALQSCNSE